MCVQVITTPFGTSFDQLRTADEVQYKFDRCCKALTVRRAAAAVHYITGGMSCNKQQCVQQLVQSYSNRLL